MKTDTWEHAKETISVEIFLEALTGLDDAEVAELIDLYKSGAHRGLGEAITTYVNAYLHKVVAFHRGEK